MPETSLDGNTFKVSGIPTPFNTGAILPFQAICDGPVPTEVVPVTINFANGTSQTWMDRNLGASRAATSIDDYQAYGCLFQWGRGNDGAASFNRSSATTGTFVNGMTAMNATSNTDTPGNQFIPIDSYPYNWRSSANDTLWQGVVTAGNNNPCPTAYRVPTNEEFKDALSGVTNAVTAYSSSLKLVSSPVIDSDGSVKIDRSQYWSSSMPSYLKGYSYSILLNNSVYYNTIDSPRSRANSVRCIKN